MLRRILPIVCLVFLIMCGIAGVAQAQQEKGDKSVRFDGSLTIPMQDTAGTTGSISLEVGFFPSKKVEWGLGSALYLQSGGMSETGESSIIATLAPYGFFRFYAKTDKGTSFPYLGVQFGSQFASNDLSSAFTDRFYARPHVGFKVFMTRSSAFDINGGYQFVFKDMSSGYIDVRFGFTFIF